MNSRRLQRIVLATLVTGVAGCATIASGKTQAISVSTNVEGAEVFLDGVRIGSTPFTGPVAKNKEQLRIELDGYRTETLTLTKSLDPIFWGNIIIGGTLGSVTDFATGAAYVYAPASYQVDLQRGDQSQEDFHHEVAVRKFSMVYVDEIALDIASGGGDYLNALTELVTLKGSEATAESVEAAFIGSEGDPIEFGNAVVALR